MTRVQYISLGVQITRYGLGIRWSTWPWLRRVNLGMIWCFGFFLEILDDCDEESQQRDDALAILDDVDRNWAAFRHLRIVKYLTADIK